MEKNCCAPQCFEGKSYKAKFSISLILKKLKLIKIILKKIIKKKQWKEKKPYKETNTVTIYSVSWENLQL